MGTAKRLVKMVWAIRRLSASLLLYRFAETEAGKTGCSKVLLFS